MSFNAQKTPLAKSLNDLARNKTLDGKQVAGQRLPCSVTKVAGAIVTVKFEVETDFNLPSVDVPIANSIYLREPTQVGDKGYVQAADARLGGVAGLFEGSADLSTPSNLGALVFVPIGNKKWEAVPDPNKTTVQGPKGVYLRDIPEDGGDETFSIVLDKDAGTITAKVGDDVSIVLDVSTITMKVKSNATIVIKDGEIDIDATTVKINGHDFNAHMHSGVTTGGGNSGGVV